MSEPVNEPLVGALAVAATKTHQLIFLGATWVSKRAEVVRFQDPGAQAVRFAAQIKLQRRTEAPITSSMSDCTQGWWERRAVSQTSAVAVALHHCICSLLPTRHPVRETDKTMINRNHYPSISKLTQPTLPYLQVRGTAL